MNALSSVLNNTLKRNVVWPEETQWVGGAEARSVLASSAEGSEAGAVASRLPKGSLLAFPLSVDGLYPKTQ